MRENSFTSWLLSFTLVATSLTAVAHEENPHPAIAPWQQASAWPDRLVTTLPDDPAKSFAVTWRTDDSVGEAVAEIAPALPDARFDVAATQVQADTQPLELDRVHRLGETSEIPFNVGLEPVHFHSVTFHDLEPDSLYAYRVRGAEGAWSEWFQIRTAPLEGPVSFIYLGDAQNGILSHWARTVRAAFRHAQDARFILHAGDLVNRASRDYEWAQWFKSVGFIHGMIPAIPVAGNHEYDRLGLPEDTTQRMLSIMWRPQFTLPVVESLPSVLHETVYEVRYHRDLHIFVLDTQGGQIAEQAAWLDERLGESDAKWRVVTMHHPTFSSGAERDNAERRALFLPVLLRHEVDLVLQGHDHTYSRGLILDDASRTADEAPVRIQAGDERRVTSMFVNSVSGAKQYQLKEDRWDGYIEDDVILQQAAENTQFYQVVEVDGDRMRYASFTATGERYDAFVMEKGPDGSKLIVPGSEYRASERLFENTGPYPGSSGLNE